MIGSEEEPDWDRRVHLPSSAGAVCASIVEIIESWHTDGVLYVIVLISLKYFRIELTRNFV